MMSEPARSHTVDESVMSTLSESTILLKSWGT